jgi:hypothetical protein
MTLFNTIKRLLPRGRAFRLTQGKSLTKMWSGIALGADSARTFVDLVFLDAFAETTRQVRRLEQEHGLPPAATEASARLRIAAERKRQRNLSPYALQKTLHDAGFTNLYVHECWDASGNLRDPRLYMDATWFGTKQMRPTSSPNVVRMRSRLNENGVPMQQHVMNVALTRRQNIAENETLQYRQRITPSSNPEDWEYYFYVGAQTFPQKAVIPDAQLDEVWFWIMRCRDLTLIPMLLVQPTSSGLPGTPSQWDAGKWDQFTWQ